jgi:hypothetical protein
MLYKLIVKKKLEYAFCLICSGCDGTAHATGKKKLFNN